MTLMTAPTTLSTMLVMVMVVIMVMTIIKTADAASVVPAYFQGCYGSSSSSSAKNKFILPTPNSIPFTLYASQFKVADCASLCETPNSFIIIGPSPVSPSMTTCNCIAANNQQWLYDRSTVGGISNLLCSSACADGNSCGGSDALGGFYYAVYLLGQPTVNAMQQLSADVQNVLLGNVAKGGVLPVIIDPSSQGAGGTASKTTTSSPLIQTTTTTSTTSTTSASPTSSLLSPFSSSTNSPASSSKTTNPTAAGGAGSNSTTVVFVTTTATIKPGFSSSHSTASTDSTSMFNLGNAQGDITNNNNNPNAAAGFSTTILAAIVAGVFAFVLIGLGCWMQLRKRGGNEDDKEVQAILKKRQKWRERRMLANGGNSEPKLSHFSNDFSEFSRPSRFQQQYQPLDNQN